VRRAALAAATIALAATIAAPARAAIAPPGWRPDVTAARAAVAPPGWRPDVAAACAYLRGRPGTVAFAVRTETRFYGFGADRVFPSASVLKAMLLAAYLRHARDRALRRDERARLASMIRRQVYFKGGRGARLALVLPGSLQSM